MAKEKKSVEKVKEVTEKSPPEPPTVTDVGQVLPGKTIEKSTEFVKKMDGKNSEKSQEKPGKGKARPSMTPVTYARVLRQAPAPVSPEHVADQSAVLKDLISDALKEFGLEKARNMSDSDISMPKLTKQVNRKRHLISDSESDLEMVMPPPRRPAKKPRADIESDEESDREFAVDEDHIDQLFSDSENEASQAAEPGEKEKDWIDEFGLEMEIDEETGPAIPQNLADIVTKMLQKRVSDDKQKEILNLPRPENVPLLVAPRVNNAIWLKINHDTRKTDIKTSHLQEKVAKTIISNVLVTEKLSQLRGKMTDPKLKTEVKEITKQALKTVQVGAIALQNISQKRRQDMKQDLNSAYRGLCSPPEKEDVELFGEGLATKVRELNEARRMGHQVAEALSKPWRRSFLGGKTRQFSNSKSLEIVHFDKEPKIFTDVKTKSGNLNLVNAITKRTKISRIEHDQKSMFSRVPVRQQPARQREVRPQHELRVPRKEADGGRIPEGLRPRQDGQEVNQMVGNDETEIDPVWEAFKDDTITHATCEVQNFKAGKLSRHLEFWKTLTKDPVIIGLISGTQIELESEINQDEIPEPYRFAKAKLVKIQAEIDKLIKKAVIEQVTVSEKHFVSNIFTRDKSDETLRIILDLTEFNEHVVYRHFKMDSLSTAIDLMFRDCFMASIDWKDAYYSVPIHFSDRNFLVFEWQGKRYRFTCYPNGLRSAPRNFTKITKVLFSELRKLGHISTSYIDDCLLIAPSVAECKDNIHDTVMMSEQAGFIVHPVKSVLEPTKRITYLGFWLDSNTMTVKLTDEKATKIKLACQTLLEKKLVTIKHLASVVGLLVASFPGVQYGQLFYRSLDNFKTKALKQAKGEYMAKTKLPSTCVQDLKWWIDNILNQTKSIETPNPHFLFETDASNGGWGGVMITETGKQSTGGHWNAEENEMHINYLELLAVWFTLQSFCRHAQNSHIRVMSDNTTTIAYLNHMGGTKEPCNTLAREIWQWCYSSNNIITSAHLPGRLNIDADTESRSIHDNMEWKLNPRLFQKICQKWQTPEIDLFANRLNKQIDVYCSWKPDPGALAIDALTENWSKWFFYAFPPFNMVGFVLRKIEQDSAEGIIVVPYWPTQNWFAKFTRMCINDPVILFSRDAQPTLLHPWRPESELPTTRLLGAHVSGLRLRSTKSQTQQGHYYWRHGDQARRNNMKGTSRNGIHFVINGSMTKCHPI